MTMSVNIQIQVPEFSTRCKEFLYRFQQNMVLCDCSILCCDGIVPVHKVILAMWGLQQEVMENSCLDVTDFSVSDVKLFLAFLYTGESSLPCNEIQKIYEIGNQLGINLTTLCSGRDDVQNEHICEHPQKLSTQKLSLTKYIEDLNSPALPRNGGVLINIDFDFVGSFDKGDMCIQNEELKKTNASCNNAFSTTDTTVHVDNAFLPHNETEFDVLGNKKNIWYNLKGISSEDDDAGEVFQTAKKFLRKKNSQQIEPLAEQDEPLFTKQGNEQSVRELGDEHLSVEQDNEYLSVKQSDEWLSEEQSNKRLSAKQGDHDELFPAKQREKKFLYYCDTDGEHISQDELKEYRYLSSTCTHEELEMFCSDENEKECVVNTRLTVKSENEITQDMQPSPILFEYQTTQKVNVSTNLLSSNADDAVEIADGKSNRDTADSCASGKQSENSLPYVNDMVKEEFQEDSSMVKHESYSDMSKEVCGDEGPKVTIDENIACNQLPISKTRLDHQNLVYTTKGIPLLPKMDQATKQMMCAPVVPVCMMPNINLASSQLSVPIVCHPNIGISTDPQNLYPGIHNPVGIAIQTCNVASMTQNALNPPVNNSSIGNQLLLPGSQTEALRTNIVVVVPPNPPFEMQNSDMFMQTCNNLNSTAVKLIAPKSGGLLQNNTTLVPAAVFPHAAVTQQTSNEETLIEPGSGSLSKITSQHPENLGSLLVEVKSSKEVHALDKLKGRNNLNKEIKNLKHRKLTQESRKCFNKKSNVTPKYYDSVQASCLSMNYADLKEQRSSNNACEIEKTNNHVKINSVNPEPVYNSVKSIETSSSVSERKVLGKGDMKDVIAVDSNKNSMLETLLKEQKIASVMTVREIEKEKEPTSNGMQQKGTFIRCRLCEGNENPFKYLKDDEEEEKRFFEHKLYNHQNSIIDGSKLKCEACGFVFHFRTRPGNYWEHCYKVHGKEFNETKIKRLYCTEENCDYWTLTTAQLKKHILEHAQKDSIKHVKQVKSKSSKTEQPSSLKKCRICKDKKTAFTYMAGDEEEEAKYLQHKLYNHRDAVINGGKLKCDVCGFIFTWSTRAGKYWEHRFKRHGKEFDESKMKKIFCTNEKCKYWTLSKKSFRQHVVDHQKQGKLKTCKECGQSYGLKNYKAHMNTHKDKRQRYPCEICGKTYLNPSLIKIHIEKIHKKMKKKYDTCYRCNISFYHKLGFLTHMLKVHDEKPPASSSAKMQNCPECDFVCLRKAELVRHELTHKIQKGIISEKIFECKACDKKFLTADRRNMHFRGCHDSPLENCPHPGCLKVMKKRYIQRHVQTVHEKKGAKDFTCHLCSYKCNREGNLVKHIRGVHKEEVLTQESLRKQAMLTGKGFQEAMKLKRRKIQENRKQDPQS